MGICLTTKPNAALEFLLKMNYKCCKRLQKFFSYRYTHSSYVWESPEGRDTGMLIYNPVVKKKVPLIVKKPFLTWYSCGPTVYDVTHIGHASSYVRLDILRRVLLRWFGVESVVAMGVTDIDDKIINKCKDLNSDLSTVARKYEIEFFDAMIKLNILSPDFILRVTEHVPEIIHFIESIIKSGHGYVLDHGTVYFDTQSFPNYGKVTRAPVLETCEEQKEGRRKHPADFALWKASKPGEPFWESPWGPGRPGWHIECSAMASKIFNSSIDLHTGGLDLAFPHHENEEAQSCAYHTTSQWVNYWLHTGHLLMNGMKMSKSMKNFISVSDFLQQHSADDFRMLCLMTHYRSGIDYSNGAMTKAKSLTTKFKTFLDNAKDYCRGSRNIGNVSGPRLIQILEETKNDIKTYLADDLNTSQCINSMENLVTEANGMLHAELPTASRDVAEMALAANLFQELLLSFGLFGGIKEERSSDAFVIDESVKFRNEVRQVARSIEDKAARMRLLEKCDQFRETLKSADIIIKDIKDQSSWSRPKP